MSIGAKANAVNAPWQKDWLLSITKSPPMEFGERLALFRKRAGLSAAEVSRRSNVKQANLSRIESGQASNPELDTIRRIAEAIGVTLADVFGDYEITLNAGSAAGFAVDAQAVTQEQLQSVQDEIHNRIQAVRQMLDSRLGKIEAALGIPPPGEPE